MEYSFAFFFSRMMMLIWYLTAIKNKKITNEPFKIGVIIDIQAFFLSALAILLVLIFPNTIFLSIM